jgi:hypothetical protein
MRGHSRSKNGVLSHAYDPRIHVFLLARKTWMAGTRPAMTKRHTGSLVMPALVAGIHVLVLQDVDARIKSAYDD